MTASYLINRVVQTIFVMWLVSVITFAFLAILPGDPVTLMIGPGAGSLTPQQIAAERHELGLDRPLPVQYVRWIGGVLTGNWGTSITTSQPVIQMIKDRAPVTLWLACVAWVWSLVVAIPTGVMAAVKRNSWLDRFATVGSVAGVAIPNFWFAILLILLFAVRLGWLPASGYVNPLHSPIGGLKTLLLPGLALGLAQMATITRQMRSSLLEVLNQDYVRTARAKGLAERAVVVRHCMKNALLPVLTIIGLRLGFLLGGSVIIEQVFALPGMGRLAVESIFAKDFPVVMGFVLLIGLAVPLANLLTDIAYGFVDPRIQLAK